LFHNSIILSALFKFGDVVLTLPVFKSVKSHDPKVHITAFIRSYTRDLFHNLPYIDNIITYSDLNSKQKSNQLCSEIMKEQFDTALVLHPNRKIAQILKKAKIPRRFSYGWKWYQYLFTKVMIQHRSKNNLHQLDYNLELLKLLNIEKYDKNITMTPLKEANVFIQNLIKSKKLDKKQFIGIHPGSGHSSLNLPPEQYVKLINMIKTKFKKVEIIITGTERDQQTIEYILKNTKYSLYPMPINLELSSLIALINKTSLFISNSTGPMHIASALRVPVIAFFSPVFIHSEKRWGPYWGKKITIKPDIDCPSQWKCKMKKCDLYNCFDKINLKQALDFIKQQLK
jgi:ADP-heptose:LPS heptosyltransferase